MRGQRNQRRNLLGIDPENLGGFPPPFFMVTANTAKKTADIGGVGGTDRITGQ